ncbi:MAG: type II toxin-antitoxin system RelE/ParE family toxin [Hyphomicrobium sp.]
MVEVRRTEEFSQWVRSIDTQTRARVLNRIDRLRLGNPGDVKPVGGGISEMRIKYGPGYRVYFVRFGASIVVLLCGGSKATQSKDIERAKRLAETLEPI